MPVVSKYNFCKIHGANNIAFNVMQHFDVILFSLKFIDVNEEWINAEKIKLAPKSVIPLDLRDNILKRQMFAVKKPLIIPAPLSPKRLLFPSKWEKK